MKKKILMASIITVALLWIQPVRAETLVVPGTGCCEVIVRKLAAAFNQRNPSHEVIVPPSTGSRGGIRSVGTDESLLARVARHLKEDEIKYDLSYLTFARDAVIFAVGAKVKVRSLTIGQLVDIFTGKIDNWQQVGGDNDKIFVLIREPGDSSLIVIQKHLEPFRGITFSDQSKTLYHDYEMTNMLTKYKKSIGFLSRSTIFPNNASIKALMIDNISPEPENIRTGKYRLAVEYAFVYKENRLNELAKRFMDFVFSDTGKRVMGEYGVIPIMRK